MANTIHWSDDQLDAIQARDGSVLVSAAAGSGKTAVLVERVLQRLTDPEDPTNADELLIVTFTKAATAEMRHRLAEAIRKQLREDPGNANLQKQQMLLPSAKICTIDSFCSTLVREHFDLLKDAGIGPDFRLMDSQEQYLLEQAAVDTVVGRLYEEDDPDFHSLVEQLYMGRNDTSLAGYLLRLHTYSRAHPDPAAWLQSALSLYQTEDPFHSPMADVLSDYLLLLMDNLLQKLDTAAVNVDGMGEEKTQKNVDVLSADANLCERIRSALEVHDFDTVLDMIPSSIDRWPPAPGLSNEPEMVAGKTAHGEFRKACKEIIPAVLCTTLEETREDLAQLRPLAEKLVEAVQRFEDELWARKVEDNKLDFQDIELLAISLLLEDPGAAEPVRTPLARDLSESFREILIDEYQDTNALQDRLFQALSKDGNNLFTVGDVKQSIYRFRQADPTIFLQKTESRVRYDRTSPSYPAKVILGKNYRSAAGILDFVNYTFEELMSREVGEITYNDDEKLYFGRDDHASDKPRRTLGGSAAELHLLSADLRSEERREAEAQYIAEYIGRTIEEHKNDPVPLHYRDFAILLRAVSNGNAETYRRVLSENGIPVYTEAGNGFLQTADIQVIVSYLRVIDNPLQDVPLLSVLLSPLFGFTPDDLAELRIAQRSGALYSAVVNAADHGNEKCRMFRDTLQFYRNLSVAMPAGELLRQIYEQTAYPSIASAMPNGNQRAANLQLLLRYADNFDQAGTFGLAGFLRFLDRLEEESSKDLDSASTLSPDADVVRIMTIHKSKGLQFPVCILANLDRQFTGGNSDTPGLLLHRELGIGLRGRNPELGVTYPTMIYNALGKAIESDERSETMRLLYVAMTRAEDKLVLVGTVEDRAKALDKAAFAATRETAAHTDDSIHGAAVHPYDVLRGTSFLHWILLALHEDPAASLLWDADVQPSDTLDFTTPLLHVHAQTILAGETESNATEEHARVNEELRDELLERMQYEYPYAALTTTVAKRAASAIDEPLFSEEYFATARPEFLSRQGLTPAQRGTCLHKFMQYADFLRAAEDPEEERARLVAEEFLTAQEAAVVPVEKVQKFFASSVAKRIFAAEDLMREQKFAVLLPAGQFDPTLPADAADEHVLIQGIVDCAFVEGGQAVILDYKTDKVSTPEELVERYRPQILTYCEALPRALGLPVKEALLYSFALDREVPVPLDGSED